METTRIFITNESIFEILVFLAVVAYSSYNLVHNHLSALLEFKLGELIAAAKRKLAEADTPKSKDIATKELLSAYNRACIAYLNKQIVPAGFTRAYMMEIERIVESEDYDDPYDSNDLADYDLEEYTGILLAYEDWEKRKRKK